MSILPSEPVPSTLLLALERIARLAGDEVLGVYATDFSVRDKADASPVTVADERAEALIVPALRALTPGVPVVAEEAAARGEAPPAAARFWLVDPLDGTREFVSRNGEFTVNLALVEDGEPRLGAVFAPVQDRLFLGEVGLGAWVVDRGLRRAVRCRALPEAGATLACSRSHGDEVALATWLQGRRVAARVAVGSSLKFGLLACGEADCYPRFGRTMEWDTAAGHAVLSAAGGQVVDLAGAPLRYGKPGYENPGFVAFGAS
jgi:3'(2'), 5'-bisphosphate nucleotidase